MSRRLRDYFSNATRRALSCSCAHGADGVGLNDRNLRSTRRSRVSPIRLLMTLMVLAGCTTYKYEPRQSIEGVYYPKGTQTLLVDRTAESSSPRIPITVSQAVRVNELGELTVRGPLRVSRSWIGRLESENGAVYVSLNQLTETGRFEYRERPPTLVDWMRHNTAVTMLILIAAALAVTTILLTVHRRRQRANKEMSRLRSEARARETEEIKLRQRYREEQERYRSQMEALGKEALEVFEHLPNLLISAEHGMDRAELDFAEHAFHPFWVSIENSTISLGCFDEGIHKIRTNLGRYAALISKYDGIPPAFSLSGQWVTKLAAGTTTAERLKKIVRTAHRDHQFAMIYGQHETNHILKAGFGTLAQALDGMGRKIAASLDGLAVSADSMANAVNVSLHALGSRVGDFTQQTAQQHSERVAQASLAAEREEKAIEILDDMMRASRRRS